MIPTHNTECGNNWLGYIVDLAPGPILIVQPTDKLIDRFNSQRLMPMIDENVRIRDKIGVSKSRDSKNKKDQKDFPGGYLILAGANSPSNLRSMPARYLLCDECDAFPRDCGGEGSPIKLAESRTTTFARNSKKFYISSPKKKKTSVIYREWIKSDQRKYHVPCPDCGHMQHLRWSQLRWERGDYKSVHYVCEECGSCIDERYKTQMLKGGEWRAEKPQNTKYCKGYHINSLYSPIGWYSWAEMAEDFDKAQGNAEELIAFVNTKLGEPWEDRGEQTDWEKLYRRKETYPLNMVPASAAVITAGVDVQKDRLEVELVAWGSGMKSWSIGYRIFKGDTTQDDVWNSLNGLLDEQFDHELGSRLQIRMMAVDSGNNTQRVYHWVRSTGSHRVMAIKGFHRDINTYMVGQPTQVDINYKGKRVHRGTKVWPVYINMAKEELFSWLTLEPGLDGGPDPNGFCHFPDYDREYFEQLCSEQKVKKTKGGSVYFVWDKLRERNEALDCRIYARAAANVLQLDKMSDKNWEKLLSGLKDQGLGIKNDQNQNTGYNGGTRPRKSAEFWS